MVHGFELGVHGTWFREYGVPGFERTGYMVSEVVGYRDRAHSFSLPQDVLVLSVISESLATLFLFNCVPTPMEFSLHESDLEIRHFKPFLCQMFFLS